MIGKFSDLENLRRMCSPLRLESTEFPSTYVCMKVEILFCKSCHIYTLMNECHQCKSTAITPKPAKYSPEDKWGKYRRLAKKPPL